MAGEGPEAEAEAESESEPEPEPVPGPEGSTDAEGSDTTVTLPDDLARWLDSLAEGDPNRDREAVLTALLAAHRELDDDGAPSTLVDRLDTQREEYVSLVEDIRERVVDLRRELDAIEGDVVDRVEAMETELDRLDQGFDNYETVLEGLGDAVEETQQRTEALASAVTELRERGGTEEDLATLKRAANRAGVRAASCENCGETVTVALLTDAECPHCQSQFVDVEPGGRLFGSPRLTVGDDRPALEGSANDGGGRA